MTSLDVKRMVKHRLRADNLRKLNVDTDDLTYLVRFWTPKPADRVLGEDAEIFSIAELSEDEECFYDQVTLSNGEVAYLQDLLWYPTDDQLETYLKQKGVVFQSDAAFFNRIFYPKPNTTSDWCKLISSLRQSAIAAGQKDFVV